MILDNLFINGALGLWNRIVPSVEEYCQEEVRCSRWRQTFLADRWKLRYDQPEGVEVIQRRSREVPPGFPGEFSVEIAGEEGLTGCLYFGQKLEAGEALRYRRRLRFSAIISGSEPLEGLMLQVESADAPNRFGSPLNPHSTLLDRVALVPVERHGEWTRYEAEFDASQASPHGLSVEILLPAEFLNKPDCYVRITALRLTDADLGFPPHERSFAEEERLARRFFQWYTVDTRNCIGRAINIDRDNLYFQLDFPEMRVAPTVSMPTDDEAIRVFAYPYLPMSGFRYEMIYRSRGSIFIKAFKKQHGLSDGYLAFVNPLGAVLLDAEL